MKTLNEESIFLSAIEMNDSTERERYLQECCQGNPEMYEKIQQLVEMHFCQGQILDETRISQEVGESDSVAEIGTVVGAYKLLQEIGEGGMGIVFMAEQSEPIKRKVAVKIIKVGMDTRRVVARFESERQAMALMDHPNITKVLDAGATETGAPIS